MVLQFGAAWLFTNDRLADFGQIFNVTVTIINTNTTSIWQDLIDSTRIIIEKKKQNKHT